MGDRGGILQHHALGGAGAVDLGKAVEKACKESTPKFEFLYPLDLPISEKISIIAKEVYKAASVEFAPAAVRSRKRQLVLSADTARSTPTELLFALQTRRALRSGACSADADCE